MAKRIQRKLSLNEVADGKQLSVNSSLSLTFPLVGRRMFRFVFPMPLELLRGNPGKQEAGAEKPRKELSPLSD